MHHVFIHGLGQTASSWDAVITNLPRDISPICTDLSGLVKNSEVTYTNLYNGFLEDCNTLSGELCLCGISLGAVMALHYTMEHPERVKSLILIAPQYKMPRLLLKLQNTIFRLMPDKAFQTMGFGKKGIISLSKSMMNLNFSSQVSNIKCPTLIVCGSKDNANKKAARYLADNIPLSRMHFIKNAGHEVNVDAPKELASAMETTHS